jgi:hypothetical protein
MLQDHEVSLDGFDPDRRPIRHLGPIATGGGSD